MADSDDSDDGDDATDEDASNDDAAADGDFAASDEAEDGLSDDQGDDAGDGSDEQDGEDSDSIFGDLRVEATPLADLAGDGLEDIKDAATSGQNAVSMLSRLPLHQLEVEHRDQVYRLKEIIGAQLTLTGTLFERKI